VTTLNLTSDLNEKWVIVSQVKSSRVVYFTNDAMYQPPTDSDVYYYSLFAGYLPEGLSLTNCWGWRFNGGVFTDARESTPKSLEVSLLELNKNALYKILNEKINLIRLPFLPSCAAGEELRKLKLAQASQYLQLDTLSTPDNRDFPLLFSVANSRGITVQEAAVLVQSKHSANIDMLIESERFREQLSSAIQAANTQAGLLNIREWLIDRVYPELSNQFPYPADHTEPYDLDKPMTDTQRIHEIAALKVKLRDVINQKRLPLKSDYVANDDIRKRKLSEAKAVYEGQMATSPRTTPLGAFAAARHLTLVEAAQVLLESAAVGAKLLAITEQAKDELLAKIERIKNLRDTAQIHYSINALLQGDPDAP
jgi:hypothetical protein